MLSGVHDLVGKARLTTMRKKAQDFDQRSRSSARGIQTRGNQRKDLERIHGIRGARTASFRAPEDIATPFSAFSLPGFITLYQGGAFWQG